MLAQAFLQTEDKWRGFSRDSNNQTSLKVWLSHHRKGLAHSLLCVVCPSETMDLNPSGPLRQLSRACSLLQTSTPDPDSSGTQPLSVGASTALTCIPGWGVTLLGLAQPPLIPGVREVNEQDQLDEDEEEGAHDAKVEPDCGERAMGRVVGAVGAATGTAGPQGS